VKPSPKQFGVTIVCLNVAKKKSHLQRPALEQSPYYTPLSSLNNNSCPTCLFSTCSDADRRSQVQTFDRGRETSPTDKQPVLLLWQPRAHNSPVPSKACQTSSASYGNSPSIGKQEHPVIVGAVRLDLTQHHLYEGSCSAVGPSPSFTQHVDIIRIPEEIPQMSALVDSSTTSSFIDQTFVAQHNIPMVKKSTPVPVEVIDGRTIISGAITRETTLLKLCIDKHTEKIVLNIISTPHHPIIPSLP